MTHHDKDDLLLEILENATQPLFIKELEQLTGLSKANVNNALVRQSYQIIKEPFKREGFKAVTLMPKFAYRIDAHPVLNKSTISEMLKLFYVSTKNREFLEMTY